MKLLAQILMVFIFATPAFATDLNDHLIYQLSFEDNADFLEKIPNDGQITFDKGVNGKALYLLGNAVIEKIETPDLTKDFTFVCWVRFNKMGYYIDFEDFNVYLSPHSPLKINQFHPSMEVKTTQWLSRDKWYQIAFSVTDSMLTLFVNGKKRGSIEYTPREEIVQPNRLDLGVGHADSSAKTCIDEIRIYDTALSANDLMNLFKQVSPELFEAERQELKPIHDKGAAISISNAPEVFKEYDDLFHAQEKEAFMEGMLATINAQPNLASKLAIYEAIGAYLLKKLSKFDTDEVDIKMIENGDALASQIMASNDIDLIGRLARLADKTQKKFCAFLDSKDDEIKSQYTKRIIERAKLQFRHSFRHGVIGEREIPTISNVYRESLESYYVGGERIEKYKYKNYESGGGSETREGYTVIYEITNNSDRYCILTLDVSALSIKTEYKVQRSFWTGRESLKTKEDNDFARHRTDLILAPGESRKDSLQIGEKKWDPEFTILEYHEVDKQWLEGLQQALNTKDFNPGFIAKLWADPYAERCDLIDKYLKDKRAAIWQSQLASAKRAVYTKQYADKITTKVVLGKNFDPDFASPVFIHITNNADRKLKVAYWHKGNKPYHWKTVSIAPGEEYREEVTVQGLSKKEALKLKRTSIVPAD